MGKRRYEMTTMTTMTTVAVLLSALGPCCARASGFAGAPQSNKCRQSLVDAPPVVGSFQIGGTQYVDPQRCALLFPFRNIYSTKEKVVGEFRARSCGECAAVCAATRYGPGFGLATQITCPISLPKGFRGYGCDIRECHACN